MARILLLGSTGMLGHQFLQLLSTTNHEVFFTSRNPQITSSKNHFNLDVTVNPEKVLGDLLEKSQPDYVINSIGLIKQLVNEKDLTDRINLIRVNAEFPHLLSRCLSGSKTRVIQIATDCVYSGQKGKYLEYALHDPVDLYGMTKSIGEIEDARFLNIRCSIIGLEKDKGKSLLAWVLRQGLGEEISGYLDHHWNGVTTVAFSKVVLGVIDGQQWKSGTYHLIPANDMNKYELITLITEEFDRTDLSVKPIFTRSPIDRTIRTLHPEYSKLLWLGAGYSDIPKIESLVQEIGRRGRL